MIDTPAPTPSRKKSGRPLAFDWGALAVGEHVMVPYPPKGETAKAYLSARAWGARHGAKFTRDRVFNLMRIRRIA